MNLKYTALLGIAVIGIPLYPIDWPAAGAAPAESNFAYNSGGAPLLGMTFAQEGPIYAAEQGEVIFERKSSERISGLPSPFGAWAAIDLGEGLVSIYARYGETEKNFSSHVEKQQIIAYAGKSGLNEKSGFYFSIFDRKERRWINPALAIIKEIPDTVPPVINAIRLKNAEGAFSNLSQTRTLPQGRYAIFAEVSDSINGKTASLAPHTIATFVNGAEAGTLVFENFLARDGLLMVYRNVLVPANQVYAEPDAYEAGEFWFSRGIATLELIVTDKAGNARTASYRLIVE